MLSLLLNRSFSHASLLLCCLDPQLNSGSAQEAFALRGSLPRLSEQPSPDFRCSASVHKLDLRLRMGAASCQAAQNSQLYERSHILSFSVARMLRGAWLAISPQLNTSVQTNRSNEALPYACQEPSSDARRRSKLGRGELRGD